MLKKIILFSVAALLLMQFIKPERNLSDEHSYDISTQYPMSADVEKTLKVACNDCHSNKTAYPWYANIQPVAWWLNHHVTDGKRHLNFSEYTKMPVAVQNHKFEEIIELTENKEMPLASYTYFGLHPEAKISEEQRHQIIDWAKAQMDTLKAHYPADSLILKHHKH